MSDDLREAIARAIDACFPLGVFDLDKAIVEAARAAIEVVIEEAAKVAEASLCDCRQWDPECSHALRAVDAIRALKGDE